MEVVMSDKEKRCFYRVEVIPLVYRKRKERPKLTSTMKKVDIAKQRLVLKDVKDRGR